MITSPEERAAVQRVVAALGQVPQGAPEEVMALSRKAAGKTPTEAHDLNTTT
jgi:methyl-accepting chemotaxis protein